MKRIAVIFELIAWQKMPTKQDKVVRRYDFTVIWAGGIWVSWIVMRRIILPPDRNGQGGNWGLDAFVVGQQIHVEKVSKFYTFGS